MWEPALSSIHDCIINFNNTNTAELIELTTTEISPDRQFVNVYLVPPFRPHMLEKTAKSL